MLEQELTFGVLMGLAGWVALRRFADAADVALIVRATRYALRGRWLTLPLWSVSLVRLATLLRL